MKAKIYTHKNTGDVDILMADGGVATLHNNGEHILTTYYQERVDITTGLDSEDVWHDLGDGKSYCKDWEGQDTITDEMILDAMQWLVFSEEDFEITNIEI